MYMVIRLTSCSLLLTWKQNVFLYEAQWLLAEIPWRYLVE